MVKSLFVLLLAFFQTIPLSFAQETPSNQSPTNTSTPIKYTCEDLGDFKKLEGKIVTILEEPIGTATTNEKYTVLNCFRTETCRTENGQQKCFPVYSTTCSTQEGTYCQPIQAYLAGSGADLLYTYVGNIYRWAAGLIGIVTVLYMIVGGIEIATAGGDSGKIDSAKERIIQSIAGLVLLFLSGLILYTINPNFFVI